MVLASAPSRRLDQRRVPSSTWFYAASSPESQRIKLSVLVLEHALKHLQEVGGGVHDAPPALLSVPNASHSAERRGVVSSHPDAARRVAQVKLERLATCSTGPVYGEVRSARPHRQCLQAEPGERKATRFRR